MNLFTNEHKDTPKLFRIRCYFLRNTIAIYLLLSFLSFLFVLFFLTLLYATLLKTWRYDFVFRYAHLPLPRLFYFPRSFNSFLVFFYSFRNCFCTLIFVRIPLWHILDSFFPSSHILRTCLFLHSFVLPFILFPYLYIVNKFLCLFFASPFNYLGNCSVRDTGLERRSGKDYSPAEW